MQLKNLSTLIHSISVEKALNDSLRRADHDEKQNYSNLESELKKLGTKINDLSRKLYERAYDLGESVDKISDNYLDVTARKFVHENKKECVVVAPDLWLPDFIESK